MNFIDPDTLLFELDFINETIRTSEDLLRALKAKQMVITKAIDEMTRPDSVPATPVSVETRKGFIYRGKFTACHTWVGLHRKVLRTLWQDFPAKQEAMADAVRNAGYNRRYIAKDRDSLFDFKSRRWTMRYSEELHSGWYMDTNVTPERIKRILPLAIRAAGLSASIDIQINWN